MVVLQDAVYGCCSVFDVHSVVDLEQVVLDFALSLNDDRFCLREKKHVVSWFHPKVSWLHPKVSLHVRASSHEVPRLTLNDHGKTWFGLAPHVDGAQI